MGHDHETGTWILTLFIAIYTYLTGIFGVLFWVLLVLMFVDVVTGLIKGAKAKNLRSNLASLGMAKKAVTVLGVVAAFLLDVTVAEVGLTQGNPSFLLLFLAYAIAVELISIHENAKALDVHLFPQPMLDTIKQLKSLYSTVQANKDNQLGEQDEKETDKDEDAETRTYTHVTKDTDGNVKDISTEEDETGKGDK